MAIALQHRRGTSSQNDVFTGASGEITVDTTNNELRLHDGTTEGGHKITLKIYPIDTVDDFSIVPSGFDTVIVKDLNRGGTFIYDATQSAVNNGGTIFNGWTRQYSGAVDVEWFANRTTAIDYCVKNTLPLDGVTGSYEVYVGTDPLTIGDAISSIRNIKPKDGSDVTIILEAGFEMREQLLIDGEDLSWIRIEGVDAITTINTTFLTSSMYLEDGAVSHPAFGVNNGRLPLFYQKFDMNDPYTKGQKHGVLANNNSSVFIAPNCGFINCPDVGLYVKSGSTAVCRDADFSGSSLGIFAFEASSVDADNAIADNCDWYGIYINRNSSVNHMYGKARNSKGDNVRCIRGSSYNGANAILSGATGDTTTNPNPVYGAGIYSLTSTVHFHNADLSSCKKGLLCEGSQAIGSDATITNSTEEGVYATKASVVSIVGSDISNSGKEAVVADSGSTVDFSNGTATGCGANGTATLWAISSSTIEAENGTLTGSLASIATVYAQRNSSVNIQASDCSGSNGSYGLRCSEGSKVNARLANVQKGGSPATSDCSIYYGGIVTFNGGTGGVSTTINTLSSSGIIFK